ncbi:MAG: class I SAM-dependent methyltransferase [Phaeodactylibacter sp.]|nr:class I SAM-dependent methyltransferase [Phaeodactylibacter sp.]
MNQVKKQVNWYEYAEKYDMLFNYNPFYQALQKEVLSLVQDWDMDNQSPIVDMGAGTGNYSIALARQFPGTQVLHIDNNEAMNARAIQKKKALALNNLDIRLQGIQETTFPADSVQGLVSVHALYTFPDPQAALRKMADWLQPGGRGILVDPGRMVNVIDWQLAIASRLLLRYGPIKTLKIFREAEPVSRQNRYIRNMQHQGKLWTHSPEEFRAALVAAGFEILESRTCFRGLSDMAIVTKS